MKKLNATGWVAVIFLAAMLMLSGCDDDEDTVSRPDMGEGAELRVVHASPDAPNVDIYAEGVASPLIRNLGYGEVSAYLDLDAGTYNIQIRSAGADSTSAPAYETGDLVIQDDVKITALAAGLLASMDDQDKFRVLPLIENFDDPGAGNAAVRIIHGSADAPTVAIDVGNDGTPEITDFERFEDTGASGVALPAGSELQIGIWAGNPLARVTAFTTPALTEGADLFVIATGLLAKLPRETDGFSLLAVGEAGALGMLKQNPYVYALHGSPDAPAVDIYAGSTMLVENIDFGDLSDPVQVIPGSYTLDFNATGTPTTAAQVTTPALEAGNMYLGIASGYLSSGPPDFQLIPLADEFTLGSSSALVRVVHASPDAPAVDVGTVSGGTVTPVADYTNLSFTDSSSGAGTALPVGNLLIGVAATGTTDPVASFNITTSAGMKAFAVAAGSLSGPGESFRLVVVNATSLPWTAVEVFPVVQ